MESRMLSSRDVLQILWLTRKLGRFVKLAKLQHGLNNLFKGPESLAPRCTCCCGAFLSHPCPGGHECVWQDRQGGAILWQEHLGGAQQVQGQEDILGGEWAQLSWQGELSLGMTSENAWLNTFSDETRNLQSGSGWPSSDSQDRGVCHQ